MVQDPVVWIIEEEHWPRANLRAELVERGFDAVGFESVADAFAALLTPGRARPAVVVVDLARQEGGIPRLAAFARAGSRLVGVRGVLQASAPGDVPGSAMLRRPVSLGEIADAVQSNVPSAAPAGLSL